MPDANSYATVGDVKWRMDGSIQPGWVRMNGGTIGNGSSGATERANADAQRAYIYLWNFFRDGIARSPAARALRRCRFRRGQSDHDPVDAGLVAAGLDDMGASPAQVLQTCGASR